MVMWLRLSGALLVTLVVLACLEYFGVSSLLGGRSADEIQHDAQSRARELFWFAIFGVVMVMSVVAAVAAKGTDTWFHPGLRETAIGVFGTERPLTVRLAVEAGLTQYPRPILSSPSSGYKSYLPRLEFQRPKRVSGSVSPRMSAGFGR